MYEISTQLKKYATLIGIMLLMFVSYHGICSIFGKYISNQGSTNTVDQQLSSIKDEANNIGATVSTTGSILRESEIREQHTLSALQNNEREARAAIEECERLIADCERILTEGTRRSTQKAE